VKKLTNEVPYSEEPKFPGIKRMIVAPIKVENDIFGVLDIRGIGSRPFPRNAESIAELLGRQLGLYYYLTTTRSKLRQAELDLEAEVQERIQTLEDLAHQIKSPVYHVQQRIQSVLRGAIEDQRLQASLLSIRGLARKANRVTMSTMLYSSLARKKSIEPKLVRLESAYLIRMLIEGASDNSLMIEPRRRISINVDRKSFEVLDHAHFEADRDLLEQALNNLLDNAAKYSYDNTTVNVRGGLTGSDRFHITVENEGLPISQADLASCVQRGWRSRLAKWTTGEGSGIGLWIVENIMSIQRGDLLIVPTNSNGVTQIRLVFSRRTGN
jgi:signal transduction histidine kinase